MICLLFFIFSLANFSSGLECQIYGQCGQGSLVGATHSWNANSCLDACVKTENCHWYTYFPSEETYNCELFSDCKAIEACSDCLTGESDCINYCNLHGLCQVNSNLITILKTNFKCLIKGKYG